MISRSKLNASVPYETISKINFAIGPGNEYPHRHQTKH